MSGHEHLETLSQAFHEHIRHPANVGELDQCNGQASMTGQCGDSIGVQIAVTGEVLADIRVQPRGCAYTTACASAMSVLAKGRTLDDALVLEPEDVAKLLGGLPEDHLHCARLAVNTLGEAISDAMNGKSEKG